MGKIDYSSKKQHGDARRIAPLVNLKRVEKGKDPYSERMINAMLNGTRSMPEYVQEEVEKYYQAQEELMKSVTV